MAAPVSTVCSPHSSRIVAYSHDRYATRVEVTDGGLARYRFVIRRLGTGEVLDHVDCAGAGPCELTSVIGMRGCSYAEVRPGRVVSGLALEAPAAGGAPSPLTVEGSSGRVPVALLQGEGDLTLKAAMRSAGRIVVIVSEAARGGCGDSTDYAVILDEVDVRTAKNHGVESGARRQPPLIDLHEGDGEPLPPLRTARIFRGLPVRTVVKAARTASAAGMSYLAACWISHNASVMSARERPILARALSDDPLLASLVPFAHRRRKPR
jgi:hypothetical protein